ncbi:hypothetical protein [Halorientalis sp.]|uniref:hypothetical protein n=1 Tax=Halorientalis sp. TaxID=1931229 RepID=UPI00261E3CAD|nr:hypothetical protein [Halorientalis sp.]
MDYALNCRLFPDSQQREQLDWVRDTVRQLHNHSLHRYNRIPETEGTVEQRVTQVRDEIPDLKDWWTDLANIYSTVLQQAVEQIATNIEITSLDSSSGCRREFSGDGCRSRCFRARNCALAACGIGGKTGRETNE